MTGTAIKPATKSDAEKELALAVVTDAIKAVAKAKIQLRYATASLCSRRVRCFIEYLGQDADEMIGEVLARNGVEIVDR